MYNTDVFGEEFARPPAATISYEEVELGLPPDQYTLILGPNSRLGRVF